jgi:ClpP class serine protease
VFTFLCVENNGGCHLPRHDLSKLGEKYGIKDATMHSTGADFKDAGSMFREMTPSERAYILNLLDQAFGQFKKVVSVGRMDGASSRLKKEINEIANGKVYSADEAKALGLIDDVAYADKVYMISAGRAGLKNPAVVKYEEPPNVFELLSADSKTPLLPAQSQGGFTINGVNVTVDSGLLHELLTPRPM